ncbi:MAG TPA: phosphodiester glycosidase family protein [Ktedonobacteraceae bacterium]|nr:phosphodiester glycosidase family protein [Ktedonobacteraceae bacterium]
MTVFKNPVSDEDTSEHTDAAQTQVYESMSPAMPPLLLNGKRQFIRPAISNQQPRSPLAPIAPASQLPVKKQFISPVVPSGKPSSPPFAQAAQSGRIVLEPRQRSLLPVSAPVIVQPQSQQLPEKRTEEKLSLNFWHREKRRQQKGKKSRHKRLRRLLIVVSLLTIIVVVFFSQGNGAGGAWLADTMRAVLGPTITAQVESWYLGLSDTSHNIQYQLGGQHVNAPWSVGTLPPTPVPPPTWSTLKPMPLTPITLMVSPSIAGEGIWYPQEQAPAPYNYLPLDAKAFIRPDPSHPYAIVTMLQFDTRFINLHMVAGTVEPGGPLNHAGPGVIPSADQQGNALLAAFNGGFKYADGQYGMMTNGVVYVPPQNGIATIAVTKEGKIILGAWGTDPRFTSTNHDLVAWRQNAALLINNGVINPLTSDGSAWGGTILNSAYTWRSGLGITAAGTLIYAAGDYLTALTLGQAMKAAGAVMAMQTDINPYGVRAFLYSRNSGGAYNIARLNPAMQGTGTEYLYGNQRDFFYLTRYSPPPPP